MSDTVASLAFGIDTSQVGPAAAALGQLSSAAAGASQAQQGLLDRTIRFQSEAMRTRDSAAQMRLAFSQISESLTTMSDTLDRATARMGATTQAFAQFAAVRNIVDAVGQSFNTSGAALEAYYHRAQQLNLTTQQTVQSMQRITEALRNQTAEGRALRTEIESLGVSLNGVSTAQAPQVLSSIIARMQGYASTPGTYRAVSGILGPIDPTTYATLRQPQMVGFEEQRFRDATVRQDQYFSGVQGRLVSDQTATSRRQAQFDDLSGQYNFRRVGIGSFGIGWDRQALAGIGGRMGMGSPLYGFDANGWTAPTQNQQLAAMQWAAAHPDDPMARGNQTWHAYLQDGFLARATGGLIGSLSGETQQAQDRYSSAANAAISRQYQEEVANSTGVFGTGYGTSIMPWIRRQMRESMAAHDRDWYVSGSNPGGAYGMLPQDTGIDDRALTPDELLRQQGAAADAVGEFGITGPSSGISAMRSLRSLRTSGTRDFFLRAMGDGEGGQRYSQVERGLEYQLAQSQIPDSADLGQARLYAMLGSSDPRQRGLSSFVSNFAMRQGMAPGQIANFGSIPNLMWGMTGGQRESLEQEMLATNQSQMGGIIGARDSALRGLSLAGMSSYGQAMSNSDNDVAGRFIQPMQEAIRGVSDTTVEALQRMIASAQDLGRAAVVAQNATQLVAAGVSAGGDASFTAALAGASPAQRQSIQAMRGIIGPASFAMADDWLTSNRAPLPPEVSQAISSASSTYGLHRDEASTFTNMMRMEGGGLNNPSQITPDALAQVRRAFPNESFDISTPQGSINAGMRYYQLLGQDPAFANNLGARTAAYNGSSARARAFAATGDLSTLSPITQQYVIRTGAAPAPAGQVLDYINNTQNPSVAVARTGIASSVQVSTNFDIQQMSESYARQHGLDPQMVQMALAGNSGAIQLLQAGINLTGTQQGAAQATLNQRGVLASANMRFATDYGAGNINLLNTQALGAAAMQGPYAMQVVRAQQEVAQRARDTPGGLTQEQQDQLLSQKMAQLGASSSLNLNQQTYGMQMGAAGMTANINTGIFASPSTISTATTLAELQNSPSYIGASSGDQNSAVAQVKASAQLQQQLTQVNNIRSAFSQMEDSAFSAFNSILLNGGRANVMLSQLLRSFANIGLTAVEKGVSNSISNVLSPTTGSGAGGAGANPFGLLGQGVLGAASWLGGLFGIGSSLSTPLIDGALIPTGRATGGIITGRRTAATGTLITRPTTYMSADGSVLAGEAGTEAIFPLTRDASGNLALRASGGGGGGGFGGGILVHAPITIQQNGPGSGGSLDPASLRATQMQFTMAARAAIKQAIADEQRPGGTLATGRHF